MTKATDHLDPERGVRQYGARYHDTADLSPALLGLTMHTTLVEARDLHHLPPCRFVVTVWPGAAEGHPTERMSRVCVELHRLAPEVVHPAWDTTGFVAAGLRAEVCAVLAPFGWTNPRHRLLDRRFRVFVYLVGFDAPIAACHLCGGPHPTSTRTAGHP